ncbi:MAG: carboxypeptidase-like regulatory domain-containing protein [Saprospiraceae bacterium]|nr:carboxypeptidase-like regulatory domain-containing protein [Saprospiraceae bacterium]
MNKTILCLTFLLSGSCAFAQKKATIINHETREYVSYVNIWVENENTGTTSNESGEFELNIDGPKNLLFSAIGYESAKINADSINEFVELKPLPIELSEVVVEAKRKTQALIIGKFKKSIINEYFGCDATPWIVARYFEYKEAYSKTPFLSHIKVLTDSDVKDAKFNVRLYGMNEKGEPEGYIYVENIIGVAKKGNRITEIDISDLGIKFPENGFFIAFEWLIIESNKYEFESTMPGSKKKHNLITYEPSFGSVPSDAEANSWIFTHGKWTRTSKNNKAANNRYRNKYNLIAIELTLTN